jgi:hypothetical protein
MRMNVVYRMSTRPASIFWIVRGCSLAISPNLSWLIFCETRSRRILAPNAFSCDVWTRSNGIAPFRTCRHKNGHSTIGREFTRSRQRQDMNSSAFLCPVAKTCRLWLPLERLRRQTRQDLAPPLRLPCRISKSAAPLRFLFCPLPGPFPYAGGQPKRFRYAYGFGNSQASRES